MSRLVRRFSRYPVAVAALALSSATAIADTVTLRIEGVVSDLYRVVAGDASDALGQEALGGSTITVFMAYDPNRAADGSQSTGLLENDGTFSWYYNDSSPLLEMQAFVGPYQGFSPFSAAAGNHYVSVLDNTVLRDFSGGPPWPVIDDSVDQFSFRSSFDSGESNFVDGLRLTWVSFGMRDRSAAILTDASLPSASEFTAFPSGSIEFDLVGGSTFITRTATITSVTVVPLPAGVWLLLSGLATAGVLRGRSARRRCDSS